MSVRATQGSASGEAQATTPTPPGPPQNVITTEVAPTSVTMDWTKPERDGGRPIEGYRVGTYESQEFTTGTSWQFTDLKPERDYTFVVSAENSVGESDKVAITVRTPREPTTPGAPRDLRALPSSARSIVVDWTPPEDDGGLPIEGYLIAWAGGASVYATETSVEVRGLTPATKYIFTVRARNALGLSPSASVSARTTLDPQPRPEPQTPSEPRALKAAKTTKNSVTVTWKKPSFQGNGTFLRYAVSWDGSRSETDATRFTIDGLAPGTDVTVSVRAFNEAKGESDPAVITVYTDPDPIPAPTVPSPPIDPEVSLVIDNSMRIDWRPPAFDGGTPVTGYQVSWGPVTDPTDRRVDTVLEPVFIAFDLQFGTEYEFSIRALNVMGASGPSSVRGWTNIDPVPAPRVPSAPRDLALVLGTPTELLLGWAAPADDGGTPIEGYVISWTAGSSPDVHLTYVEDPYVLLLGLTPATTHAIEVRALNGTGLSLPASLSATTIIDPVPTPQIPSSPRDLVVTGTTPTSIALRWTAPASDGGSPVTAYLVRAAGVPPVLVTDTTALLTGLVPERTYDMSVQAVNQLGESESARVTGRTQASPPAPGPTPGRRRSLRARPERTPMAPSISTGSRGPCARPRPASGPPT